MTGGSQALSELFLLAVKTARESGASDIHIEPNPDGVRIRMRVHGVMEEPWREVPKEFGPSFIRAVKKATGLEIGVSGRPQDGRLTVAGLKLDLRVNLLPSLFGEKLVLRLLPQDKSFSLAGSGAGEEALSAMRRALCYENGVIIVSGPTGSGKTTTLYSLLAEVDRSATNVLTLEDPVEYTLPLVTQVQITRDLTFAAALRAVLRQDPDVIMVGEIRDSETAELAFQAAATGHLVLSTVHANGAAEVVTRLSGLGISRDVVAENLRFAGAQRLLPRLCPGCSSPAQEGGTLRHKGEGCKRCRGGSIGVALAVEFLDAHEINAFAAGGVPAVKRSLAAATTELANAGVIDCREVLKDE